MNNLWRNKHECKRKMKGMAHKGKPIQLFKDSDRDGVANVFDCKPYNRKKQDTGFRFNYTAKQQAIKNIETEEKEKKSNKDWDKIKDELGID